MARAASVDVRFLTVGTESGQPRFTNGIQLEFQKPFVDVQRLCWLLVKKRKTRPPGVAGVIGRSGREPDFLRFSHVKTAVWVLWLVWCAAIPSFHSTKLPNITKPANQIQWIRWPWVDFPPGKELGSIQHPIYRYLPSSALGPFFWFIHLRHWYWCGILHSFDVWFAKEKTPLGNKLDNGNHVPKHGKSVGFIELINKEHATHHQKKHIQHKRKHGTS